MGLYSSARFDAKVRFPAVHGLVSAVWTFHYEEHYNATTDPQFVSKVSQAPFTITNHEIDIEIPANCGPFEPTPGRYDTMNLNNYIYTNENGAGPAYANLCVRSPNGTGFIDDKYHTYAFEWHAGNPSTGCLPRVDFFWDSFYVGTVNVFAPTRASRLVIAIWPGSNGWVGPADDWPADEVYAYVSEVNICPFKEESDFIYPQNYDQPPSSATWTTKTIPPVISGLPGPTEKCNAV
eukprot:TRINITY_DN7623_c0_g1_i3.p1 TRINITY_DN7623_c0_g1~~TRINITY_DN7623_c0_g1_i3.p1  ORF type:complete len:236 (+),score=30.95 TRINITY_DN7623_c0_g1_i3:544-1251(+)